MALNAMADYVKSMSAGKTFLHIKKEALKFSAAHMTVFPDGSKERLHGHNYTVDVMLEMKQGDPSRLLSFAEVKSAMKGLCDEWDEKVLLAEQCSQFKVRKNDETEIDFLLCGSRYVLPKIDLCLIPVDNITSESLAQVFAEQLRNGLRALVPLPELQMLTVRIEESPGQGASYQMKF
jgi:6-pyruvoyltetrahydropterin/6-carboxytetrahydropterin synthase